MAGQMGPVMAVVTGPMGLEAAAITGPMGLEVAAPSVAGKLLQKKGIGRVAGLLLLLQRPRLGMVAAVLVQAPAQPGETKRVNFFHHNKCLRLTSLLNII